MTSLFTEHPALGALQKHQRDRRMADAMSYARRDLIESVRKANKLLSLYVLALQEDSVLRQTDHTRLVDALRALGDVIEEQVGTAASSEPPVTDAVKNVVQTYRSNCGGLT